MAHLLRCAGCKIIAVNLAQDNNIKYILFKRQYLYIKKYFAFSRHIVIYTGKNYYYFVLVFIMYFGHLSCNMVARRRPPHRFR